MTTMPLKRAAPLAAGARLWTAFTSEKLRSLGTTLGWLALAAALPLMLLAGLAGSA